MLVFSIRIQTESRSHVEANTTAGGGGGYLHSAVAKIMAGDTTVLYSTVHH